MITCFGGLRALPHSIYFFCSSSPALQVIQDTQSIKAHSFALRFHKVLTTFFSNHRGYTLYCAGLLKTIIWKGTGLPRLWLPKAVERIWQICLMAWIAFSPQLSRRTEHADRPSITGRWTTTWTGRAMICRSAPLANPWTGRRYPNPPPRLTTLSGPQRSPWRRTSGVVRHGILSSHGGPLPRHCSSP
jgi:hypothetical protein